MRALTDTERQTRRDDLAERATRLFGEVGWSGLTIDAVAQAAGLAKGTIFLSFASKEDLVLHAVALRFDAWFARLAAVDSRLPVPELAGEVLNTLRADPNLLPLMALVGPVLEVGCSAKAVVQFKERLAGNLGLLAAAWSPHRPEVRAEEWPALFLRVYALIVGAWSVGEASHRVKAALASRPDLLPLLTSFDALLVPMLEAELRSTLGHDS